METIRFISVSFNNTSYSMKLLESLAIQSDSGELFSLECVIVDNSNNEREAKDCQELSQHYSWVTYLRAPENLGYFGGLNYGLSATNTNDASFVIICNNDLQFDSGFCRTLSSKAYNANIFAVCPDVITLDDRHQNPHILSRISRIRRFQFDVYYSHYYMSRILLLILRAVRPVKTSPPQPRNGCELHMGVGACYVLTKEFLKRFKRLTYPFFLYGEEAYLSEQIHSAGGILWYDPDLPVHHAESAAFSKLPTRRAYEWERTGYPDYKRLM
jgi:GT2 family glycosyltransferase